MYKQRNGITLQQYKNAHKFLVDYKLIKLLLQFCCYFPTLKTHTELENYK